MLRSQTTQHSLHCKHSVPASFFLTSASGVPGGFLMDPEDSLRSVLLFSTHFLPPADGVVLPDVTLEVFLLGGGVLNDGFLLLDVELFLLLN